MTNHYLIKSIVLASLLIWSGFATSQDSDELLSIYELNRLREYEVMHDDDGKTIALIDGEWKHQEAYPEIESAVFIPNPNYVDTFNFSPEQFPNLKSAQFLDLYYNLLIGVSKFKNLQYLDIGALNYVEHMLYSYVLNFPEEFWSLKKLQVLHAYCSQFSDFSENIQRLESLKILNTGTAHGDKDQLIIPWSLLLMPRFSILIVTPNLYQEEFDLFQTHAHFTVTDDTYNSLLIGLKPEQDVRDVFQKTPSYEKSNNAFVLENDTLKLTVPLSVDQSSIDGVAILKKKNKVIQKRRYKSGVGHGSWSIQNAAGTQKRKYSHGVPVGRWTSKNPRQRIRNQTLIFEKSTSEFRVKGNPITSKIYYKDFNHEYHFHVLREFIEQNDS